MGKADKRNEKEKKRCRRDFDGASYMVAATGFEPVTLRV